MKDNPNCFNVFIHANNESRKNKITNEYGVKTKITDKQLIEKDLERANYCLHYTGNNWNDASNYDMTIDSSRYSSDEVAQLIKSAVDNLGH